jgi:hypothetical protein
MYLTSENYLGFPDIFNIVRILGECKKRFFILREQSCRTRTQNNSTSTSPSFCEIWKASPRTITSFNSPRTLVLWRRWLQALGLFYKKNMPNNNTAYPICKINLSFISFLWVEQWSGGADVESRNTHMHSLSGQLILNWSELLQWRCVGCGQWWAAILKNVSFKAIQIHNCWEKNRIKRYNFVRQNFCHRWSDRKNQTKIFLHWWSDKIAQILCYKAIFLFIQTYFPSDEAIQSVQNPIFWSDAAIQYPKESFTWHDLRQNIAQQKIYFFFRNI